MPSGRRDKTTGLPIPSPVVPATSICFTIQVPNAIEYRSAFKGALSSLGQAWTWAQTEGQDNQDAFDAAELWRARIQEAIYSLDCGDDPMSCEDVANCIETDAAVQAAIAQQIATNQANQTTVYNTSVYGTPMTDAQANEAITDAPGCDEDTLFGSITEIVDQLDQNNRDFLEIVEVGTNTRERVSQAIAAIPLLETLPINEVIDFVDKLQTEILENYEAQWTSSLRDEYRCQLFCIALESEGCELTFDSLFEYWNDRLGAALEPLNFFTAVANYFLLGTWAGTTVVDIMMLVQLGTWREASNWVGVSLRTLQTVGLLGANNPDPDWAVIPCDCAPPPVDGCFDLTANAYTWYAANASGAPDPGYGSWVLGQGLIPGPGNAAFFARGAEASRLVSEIRVRTSVPTPEMWLGQIGSFYLPSNDGTTTEHVYNATSHPGYFPRDIGFQQFITFPGNVAPSGANVIEFCFTED